MRCAGCAGSGAWLGGPHAAWGPAGQQRSARAGAIVAAKSRWFWLEPEAVRAHRLRCERVVRGVAHVNLAQIARDLRVACHTHASWSVWRAIHAPLQAGCVSEVAPPSRRSEERGMRRHEGHARTLMRAEHFPVGTGVQVRRIHTHRGTAVSHKLLRASLSRHASGSGRRFRLAGPATTCAHPCKTLSSPPPRNIHVCFQTTTHNIPAHHIAMEARPGAVRPPCRPMRSAMRRGSGSTSAWRGQRRRTRLAA